MRILGKGKTAQAIKEVYKDAILFDDNDSNIYDINSDELTVVSPGIPPNNYMVQNTRNLISEYDLFSDKIPFSVWISGTNGKTTTTQMLQHLLKATNSQAGGNIGFPLAKMDVTKKIWILETSSFTLHYTNKAKPNIYILLPVSEDHLSWHGSFKEYVEAKLKPLILMSENDTVILPSRFKKYKTQAKAIYYDNTKDLEEIFSIDSTKIKFKEPFLMDAVVSLAIAQVITNKTDYNLINSFVQDPHKLEEFRDFKNRIWVDDSKATNVDATIQALKTYKDKNIYLILGGDDKGADLIPLFKELTNYKIKLYVIGKNADKLFSLAQKYKIEAIQSDILKKAVAQINLDFIDIQYGLALLSPAAASFDQFSSYKDRGDQFKEFIGKSDQL